LAGGTAGELVLLNPREGAFKPLFDIDFTKMGLPAASAWCRLISTRTDGWIWRSRIRARRGLVCGEMWTGNIWSAWRCRILVGKRLGNRGD